MTTPLSRRDFLVHASVASASSLIAGTRLFANDRAPAVGVAGTSANDKLNVAICGAGGRGMAAVEAMAAENIVAICDVDEVRSAEARKLHPRARFFHDFREMFDKMGNEIDAVTVSTPDHMHFPIAMAAIALGKHVYVEKPLTHDVWEARQLLHAARKAGVITQMGNQGHTNEGTRLIREWIQAGALGDILEVHHWTNRPIWPQGMEGRPDHSNGAPPVPETLDWDLWLGVAPERPYDPAYVPFKWRGWWDFGTGALGDMGCHVMDAAYWGLDLDAPEWVEASSTSFNDEAAPGASIVTYHYPARGKMKPVTVKWYDGDLKPPLPAGVPSDTRLPHSGTLYIGTKYVMMSDTYNGSVRIVPESAMREFAPNRPPRTIPRLPEADPFKEWAVAIKGGPLPGSNFEYSTRLTEAVLLGNVAIRARHRIYWDKENLRITNLEEANQYLRREYRPGFGV